MMSESKNNPIDSVHVREQLSDYMDGLLPNDEHETVRAHLEECADCRADYAELRTTQKLLQTMPAIASPRSFTLTPEMAGQVRKASFWDRLFVPRNAPKLATGSVIAFVLLFLFMVGDFRMGNAIYTPAVSTAASGGAASEQSTQGYDSSAKAAPTDTTAAAAVVPPVAATPAEPSAGGNAANQSVPAPLAENTPLLTPNTEVGTGGTSGITTTTSDVAPAPPSGDGTISGDRLYVSPAPSTEGTAAPNSDNRTGGVALQLGLLTLGLALGVAAFIAWRRT